MVSMSLALVYGKWLEVRSASVLKEVRKGDNEELLAEVDMIVLAGVRVITSLIQTATMTVDHVVVGGYSSIPAEHAQL